MPEAALVASDRLTVRVLVVDDDATVAEVVSRYLEREGFEVESVEDGRVALQRAFADPPDLIVLDLMLPGMDGLEVCRQVRTFAPIPIIMLTARGDEDQRVAGLEMGADDYVAKPFSPRELTARVKSVLRRSAGPSPVADRQKPLRTGDLELDPKSREWGYTFGDTSTVTVHVRRLREKVEEDPASPGHVRTVWGVGYRFDP